MLSTSEIFAILTDYVERSTHWREGGVDRHAAKLALKDFGQILAETGSAPVAQELREGVKIGRQARAMYAKSPTYKGTTPMTWDEAPLEVKREWVEKAKEQPATEQEPVYQIRFYENRAVWHDVNLAAYAARPDYGRRILYTTPPPVPAQQEPELAPKEEGHGNRVLVVVSGGVADPVCDAGVDVEVFDWDNYNADPEGTGGVPSHFADLAEGLGIPVSEVSKPANRPRP